MRVGIIGLGYVGLTLAIIAASKGIEVHGVEIDEHIKACLRENRAHFYEPGLDNLIARTNGRSFFVVDKFDKNKTYDAFIITVGTPLKKIGGGENAETPNFDYIKSAVSETISEVYDGTQLVILRSTVSVGTTREIIIPLLSGMSGRKEDEVLVGMCPERTVEGNALNELTNLPQIISGNNEKSIEISQKLFRQITPCVVEVNTIEEAELIKLYCNVFRDMTFAIGNAFCMAAQEFGVDGIKAIEHSNYGYGRSTIAKPGFVAGPCLEKDAYILINNMPDCASRDFILSGRKYNESLVDMVVQWVDDKFHSHSGEKVVAISGLAFKGMPETSDLRGSSSVYIAQKLRQRGYTLNLHDYVAHPSDMANLCIGTVFDDIYEACENASLLLVLNNHKKYSSVVEKSVFYNERNGFEILDSWGVCSELYQCDKIKISSLGNMKI